MAVTNPIVETTTSKDGTRIGWARSGEGPSLVLVHGTTADRTRWAPVLPALDERFSVYGVDRRGRGASGGAASYSVEREYEDIAAVVDAIERPVNLPGLLWGTVLARRIASHAKPRPADSLRAGPDWRRVSTRFSRASPAGPGRR